MSATAPPSIELRSLSGTRAEADVVQRIYDDAPAYAVMIHGQPDRPGAAMRTFDMLPDGCSLDAKNMFVIARDGEPVGFTDVIRGFPAADCAYIGLFILVESCQGAGVGRRAYGELEALIAGWPEIDQIQLSVVEINAPALRFWGAMGFEPTGERTPYEDGTVRSEHVFFTKRLDAEK